MDLISKIVRLNKIPELLKHKQEEEEEAKNDRRRRDNPKRDKDENREAAHFEIGAVRKCENLVDLKKS